MTDATRALVLERRLAKGDALEVARIAGIMGAKKTAELVPLCHPIALGAVEVEFAPDAYGISVTATARTSDRTGVEMEAMTAVAAAALTLYDMVKGTERGVTITDVKLMRKSGGRTGEWVRTEG
jgi:cyclic pyranopterin phosphate synthase